MVLYYNHTLESPAKYVPKHLVPTPQRLISYVWGGNRVSLFFKSTQDDLNMTVEYLGCTHEVGDGEVYKMSKNWALS